METAHVCMKTYYVRARTGEIRPITTKAFLCPKLGTDLLSVKGLNSKDTALCITLIPTNQEYFRSSMGKQTSPNLLHIWVSTQIFFI